MSATTSYGHAGAMGRHRVPLTNSVCSVSAKTIVQAEPHLVGVCDFERGRRDRSTVLPRRANPSRSRVGDRPGALVRGAEKTFDNAKSCTSRQHFWQKPVQRHEFVAPRAG